MERLIFHIDVNSAFLSWESARRVSQGLPDLREIPSCVGGDPKKRTGIVVAKSIPAKKYGIQTGEPVAMALRKCPNLVIVPSDFELYDKCSRAFKAICASFAPVMESFSIDEVFLDMTGTSLIYPDPVAAAHELKDKIHRELGFTVNVGISVNKLLAKMASDFQKPDRVHTLYPEEIPVKMWPLPVSDLFFVGRATTKKLLALGITTIGELAQADPVWLRKILKKEGEIVWAFANGMDESPVLNEAPANKGYGNSTTTPFDVRDYDTAKKVLLGLSETVGSRLRADHVEIEVVTVGIRYSDLSYISHQKKLLNSTNLTIKIYETACGLFQELWNGEPIRHLGVHTGKVLDGDIFRQLDLFDETDYDKLAKADATLDEIRERFGIDAVKRAVFVDSPIDHMSGGISREKRTVDYSKVDVQ